MSDDLIDRQYAIATAITGRTREIDGERWIRTSEVRESLRHCPSAQPERKTGRWIVKTVNTFEMAYGSTGYEPVYECSLCGGVEESYLRFDEPIMPEDANFPNYCPHCGAKMGGDAE